MKSRLILRQTNGILVYDEKGAVPEVPENYKASPSNPYMLYPILKQCSHRDYKTTYTAKCGCTHKKMYCNHFSSVVNVLKCMTCPISDGLVAEDTSHCN